MYSPSAGNNPLILQVCLAIHVFEFVVRTLKEFVLFQLIAIVVTFLAMAMLSETLSVIYGAFDLVSSVG